MNEKGSNHQLLKRSNYNLVKKCIYQNSPISRVEVAHKLNLTTPTITSMVTPLLNKGLLRDTAVSTGEEGKTAGRPRVMLEFVPNAHYLCGVDVGPYWINYVMTDLHGAVIASLHTEATLDEYHKTLTILKRDLPLFLKEAGIPPKKLLGIGICLPGLIDGSAGKIYTTFRKGWTDHDLGLELKKALGVPVVVENNVRARMIGADLFDRAVKEEPFAYFFVSYGIACQMIIDGKVLYGQSAAAGEIGHTVVERGGPVCPTCGNQGCLEALAGERAVLQRCRDILRSGNPTVLRELCERPEDLTITHIMKAQELEDREVNLVMEDVLDYLGISLANTINTVSPKTVMLDAHILDSQRNRELMLRAVTRNMFRVHAGKIQFIFKPYDQYSGARGAAAVVVRELLLNSDL